MSTLDMDHFFVLTSGAAVRILDGTQYHGQIVRCVLTHDNMKLVELADGTLYTLLFNEWEAVLPPKPPPAPPPKKKPEVPSYLLDIIKPKPPSEPYAHPKVVTKPRVIISRCPRCRIEDTLDVASQVFRCCGMHTEQAIYNSVIERLDY